MPKKSRSGSTPQERLVAEFSRHSISSRNTFHPNLWKKLGREPADMIILIGRAVLFVNMTKGNSDFQTLARHNIDQARNRMFDWATGPSIKGANEWREFDISWSAVDHIAVISVVDGRHAACSYHELSPLGLDSKVCLCATVTSQVMYSLANKSGGARDLLSFCLSLKGLGLLHHSIGAVLLQSQYDAIRRPFDETTRTPTRLGRAIVNGIELNPLDEFALYFSSMRRQGSMPLDAFSDLGWRDVFSVASFLANSAAEMEWLPHGEVQRARFGERAKFSTIISTNMDAIAKLSGTLFEEEKAFGSRFIATFMLTNIGVVPMFACIDDDPLSVSETNYFLIKVAEMNDELANGGQE
jgi:hypothetical protein